MDYTWMASVAAMITTMSLLISFVALFLLLAFSIWSGIRNDAAYDTRPLNDQQSTRAIRSSVPSTASLR